jgi:hypothetical protein
VCRLTCLATNERSREHLNPGIHDHSAQEAAPPPAPPNNFPRLCCGRIGCSSSCGSPLWSSSSTSTYRSARADPHRTTAPYSTYRSARADPHWITAPHTNTWRSTADPEATDQSFAQSQTAVAADSTCRSSRSTADPKATEGPTEASYSRASFCGPQASSCIP